MDVREKLVELLLKEDDLCKPNECKDCGANGSCYYHRAANRIIAHGVTVQEWKPISEPPKEKGTYLVCTDNGGVLLGHWYGTAWNAGGGAKKHLAYWMKKPEPPKGE